MSAIRRTSVSGTDRAPRRGLPLPKHHNHWLSSFPYLPFSLATSAQQYGNMMRCRTSVGCRNSAGWSVTLDVEFSRRQKMRRPGGWCRRSGAGPAAPVPPADATMANAGPCLQLGDFLHAHISSQAYGRLANMRLDSSEGHGGVGRNKHANIHTASSYN